MLVTRGVLVLSNARYSVFVDLSWHFGSANRSSSEALSSVRFSCEQTKTRHQSQHHPGSKHRRLMKENHPHDDSHFYCRSQWWKKTCFTVNFLIIVTFILASSCYAGWCIGREYGNLHRHHHAIVRGWIVASSQSHPFSRQRKQESESLTTTQYSTVSVQDREQRKTNILLSSPSASMTKQTKGRVNSSCAHACIAAAPPILLHPALLAHRNPRQITIITAISTTTEQVDDSASLTIDRYIQEAVKHKAVENIKFFIVGNDSGERKLESPSMTGVTISFQWVTGEDFQEDADSSASREGGLRMGDEVDEHVQADEQPINVLFVDASITCQFSAHVVASWYERLLPKQGIVHHEHPMMMVELGWMASSPRTAAYRNALADRLDPANSATSSAVKMADFDGHWSEGSFVNRNLIVVFSTLSAQAFWHRSESEWNLVIHQQMEPYSKDQDHGLEYLDSTLMSLLEYPSKHSELEFCRRYPLLYDCRRGGSGFDPHKLNIKLEHLTVGKSRQGEHAGRGVFTLVDIPKKSYIGAENQEYARCRWKCNKLIQDMAYDLDNKSLKKRHLSIVMQFHGYGTSDQRWVRNASHSYV